MSEWDQRLAGLSPKKRELLLEALLRRQPTGAVASAEIAARRPSTFPVAPAQERFWFLDRLDPASPLYAMIGAHRLDGAVTEAALAAAFVRLVERHEALRTIFPEQDGRPLQRVLPAAAARPVLAVVDLGALAPAAAEESLRRLLARVARLPFDLARGPLLRPVLARLAPERRVLLLALHHIVSDGWSMGVLIRDLRAFYLAVLRGGAAALPPLALQYGDWAAEQQRRLGAEGVRAQLGYWRARLAGAPAVLELAADRPRPAVRSPRGGQHRFVLPRALALAVRRLAAAEGATPFMVWLAGFAALLHRRSGEDDFTIGTPIANRDRRETEELIGLLLNTLVLRIDASGAPSLRELVRRVRTATLEAFRHADLPFERLVEELSPERSLAHTPLFQVMLVFQDVAPAPERPRGAEDRLAIEPVALHTGTAKLDLLLDLNERGGALEYSADLFDPTTARRIVAAFAALLGAALAEPELPIAALPAMPAGERHQLLCEWGDGAQLTGALLAGAPIAAERIEALVTAAARRVPAAPAVAALGTLPGAAPSVWSYAELECRSAALAGRLRRLGVGPEVVVAVCLERRPELIAALCAVWRAGGCAVPLDPAYPAERLAFLLADSGARLIVAEVATLACLPSEPDLPRLLLEEVGPEQGVADATPPTFDPDALAYLIYTSGSTGRPKGVEITHRSAVALLRWAAAEFPEAALGAVLAGTSVCFDLSVFELWLPLTTGGRVVLAPDVLALPRCARELPEHPVVLVNTVPSAMAELVRERALPPSVLAVNLAGEPLRRELVEAVLRAAAGRTPPRVLDLYGPSETTTYSTWAVANAGEEPSIGRPIAGTRALVVDRAGRPVPLGVPGELLLGGAGLARGYRRRPAATAERFIPDAGAKAPGARLYRTGDRVRWRRDGGLDFLGRLDRQVKLRGFRIEPGEVEAVLGHHPAVAAAAVLVREDRPGDLRLVAYVEPTAGAVVSEQALREDLATRLPAHLVPSIIVVLAALPLTANGKVDRRALPAPVALGAGAGPAQPRGGAEELLAELWTEVLGRAPSPGSDFFAEGGHSLLATQLVSRVRRVFGVELEVRAVFRHPTLAQLALHLETGLRACTHTPSPPPVVRRDATLPAPLSFAQERLWFLDQLEPGNPAYNLPLSLRLVGALDLAALRRAVAELVRRHEVLRTCFTGGAEAVQVVEPAATAAAGRVLVVDLGALDAGARGMLARRLAAAAGRRSFDLARGPLLRVELLRLAAADHVLVVVAHHAVSDGWSSGVLTGELAALYGAFRAGRPSPLPELELQYGDWAAWQRGWLRGEVLAQLVGFWRAQLGAGPHVLELPTDRARPPVQSFRGDRRVRRLPAAVSDALRRLSRAHGATLFMTLLALFTTLLARIAGVSRGAVSVGSPVAGRNRAEIEPLIGFFVNTLVLRTELDDSLPFARLLERVRERTLDAQAHQDLPFEKLVEALDPKLVARDLARSPLFQVLFAFQNTPRPAIELPGLTVVTPPDAGTGATKFELTLDVHDDPGGLVAACEHNLDLFDATTVERLLRRLETLAAAAAADPERALGELPVVSPAERFQALVEHNDTSLPAPASAVAASLHGRFFERARRAPEGLAVVAEKPGSAGAERLDAGELARRALELAGRLRAAGVVAETRVGVLLPRTPDLPVALLAVLAAGGAYVPLDPSYPPERIAFMLEDSGAASVITDTRGAAALSVLGSLLPVLRVDAPESGAAPAAPAPVDPDQLAYVIYTSGSTGKPKGVMIRHRSAAALVEWAARHFPEAADPGRAVLAATSICFDLSVFELFVPLALGGVVALAENALHLGALAARVPVALVNTVPSALAELVRGGELPASVVTVNLAGEPLEQGLVEAIYRRGPRVGRVVNLYGPSEDTTYSTWAVIAAGETPTIGRPVAATRAYVLDAGGRAVPPGSVGELCLAGIGLARGYLRRPGLSAERFVPDRLGERASPGGRLYRTGDLARQLPDGRLCFLGRRDHQVKLRGFRIELGEIEATLRRHPAVAQAVVQAVVQALVGVRPVSDGGDPRLVAWVVPATDEAPDPTALRGWLGQRLPAYMVPAAIVPLAALPLSANGKIDRGALPEPGAPTSTQLYEAPRNALERKVAAVWAAVLGVERVGIHDNFFDLGGHSLLMVRAHQRLQEELGRELALIANFAHPTVAALAAFLGGATDEPEARRAGEQRGARRRDAAAARRAQRPAGDQNR